MKVLVLGDPHLPAPDWDLLKEAHEFNRTFRANRIVCVGDLTDQKTWSKYGRDTDDVGNDEEWELTIGATRSFKAANLAGVPSKLVKSLSEALPAPGWRWYDTSRGPLMLDGVGYIHGDEQSGSALAKASFVGHPIVQGHDHKGIL